MTGRGALPAVFFAALAAILLVAQQVAGRALRDAFFLSHFPVATLPNVVLASAGLALVVAFAVTRILLRSGPGRAIPRILVGSAALHVVEWLLALRQPGAAAILVYLHTASLGITVISGFWSLVSESLDPRSMRKSMGRLTGGATVGGVLGGLLAERMGAWGSAVDGLLALGILHLAAGAAIATFARRAPGAIPTARAAPGESNFFSGARTLRDVPYLRDMAILVILGATAAMFLDYMFKAEAAAAVTEPGRLLRFFAWFHTAVAMGALLVQAALSRLVLERGGLGPAVGSLPGTVLVTSLGALAFPGLGSATVARGAETVLRNSLFRSGYEPHFAPVPPERKRGCKTLIDVAGERTGDAIGGAVVKAVLLLGPAATRPTLYGFAILAAGIGLLTARRLRRGYVAALESSLLDRGGHLDLGDLRDDAAKSSVLRTLSGLRVDPDLLGELRRQIAGSDTGIPGPGSSAPSSERSAALLDPMAAAREELRSRDPARVRAALTGPGPVAPALVPEVLRLLAWDAVAETAVRALIRTGPPAAAALCAALLDPAEEFAVRRRVPRVLAALPSEETARALFAGLRDSRFEVRFQSGRALLRVSPEGAPSPLDPGEVLAAIRREVRVDRRVWVGRRLLEDPDAAGESIFVDRMLAERADRSLEHVFTLLSLILPREPLGIAYRGLHAQDPLLRGTALEYLESVLPEDLRESLWPFLEPSGRPRTPSDRPREEILASLLASNQTLQVHLADLRVLLEKPKPPDAGE